MNDTTDKAWRCLVCGYVHRGPAPPETCPVCGAPAEDFEPMEETVQALTDELEAPQAAPAGGTLNVVIVGAGIAGLSAAEAVRTGSPQARIKLVSQEEELPYYRLNLTRYLAGEITEQELPIHPESWYADQQIELLRGVTVTEIDPAGHRLTLDPGGPVEFDKLILTAGANPFIPPVEGSEREGVTALRTLGDANRILAACRARAACVCIGGGILGLEAAAGLARQGVDVTLLEGSEWLLPRQLNRRAGEILGRRVAQLGIKLHPRAKTKCIYGGGRAEGVELADGERLPADLVLITTGIRPNTRLAAEAGLTVKQGIVVDNYLVSSHPDILAAGDVAEHQGVVYGLWGPAQYQGSITGMNAAGGRVEFGGVPRATTLKVVGADLFSLGQIEPGDAKCEIADQEADGHYIRLIVREGKLAGAILLGDTAAAGALKKAMETGQDLSGLLGKGLTPGEVVESLREAR